MRHTRFLHRWAMLASSLLLLGACASTPASFKAQVTQYQQWPADAQGATFRVSSVAQAASANWGELERQSYEQRTTAALTALGLQPAAADQAARLTVSLRLDSRDDRITVQEPVIAHPPYGWGGYPGYWPGYWDDGVFARRHWPAAPVYYGQRQYERQIQNHLLTLRISDTAAQGQTVFEGSAQASTMSTTPAQFMPYLIEAVLQDFPGSQSGVTRGVAIPLQAPPTPAP